MWKNLLAGAFLLGVTGGSTLAQGTDVPAGNAYSGTQGSLAASAAGANNNRNVSAAPVPGPAPAPNPGEMIFRFGGRVNVQGGLGSSSLDSVAGARAPVR